MTLSGVAAQPQSDLRVIVADQGQPHVDDTPVVCMLLRVLEARGGAAERHGRQPIHCITEQRDFLLRQATADAVLYLDDDVLLEPWVLARMLDVLRAQGCAFVGAFPSGLSHRDDMRPQQQIVDFRDSPVQPEIVNPGSREWEGLHLHRAANLYNASQHLLRPGEWRLYKVAWVASCVLFDRRKLLNAGGFSFWPRLPRWHSSEEVLVQNLLMRRWGGCALMPSGAHRTDRLSAPGVSHGGDSRVAFWGHESTIRCRILAYQAE
jgi:hypothetical protein